VNRLRSLGFRHSALPFVLAALALRALIPAGFMPTANGELRFMSTLCSSQAPGSAQSARLPGDVTPACEYCVAPLLGAPVAHAAPAVLRVARIVERAPATAQLLSTPLTRAFGARAPPA
jgi:hypothetical protein